LDDFLEFLVFFMGNPCSPLCLEFLGFFWIGTEQSRQPSFVAALVSVCCPWIVFLPIVQQISAIAKVYPLERFKR